MNFNDEKIEDYIFGRLSDEERDAFQFALMRDADLRKQVESMRTLKYMARAKKKEKRRTVFFLPKRLLRVAAVLIGLTTLGVLFALYNKNKKEEFVNENKPSPSEKKNDLPIAEDEEIKTPQIELKDSIENDIVNTPPDNGKKLQPPQKEKPRLKNRKKKSGAPKNNKENYIVNKKEKPPEKPIAYDFQYEIKIRKADRDASMMIDPGNGYADQNKIPPSPPLPSVAAPEDMLPNIFLEKLIDSFPNKDSIGLTFNMEDIFLRNEYGISWVDFNGSILIDKKEELTFYVYSNKPADFQEKKPMVASDLYYYYKFIINDVNEYFQASIRGNFKLGLYYAVIVSKTDGKIRAVNKFEIKAEE